MTGHRVVIVELGETPMEAVEKHLRIEPQEPPDPATLGPRDVVVAIRSAGLGWVDLLMGSGQYQHPAQPPFTPGMEYAGVVTWAGPEAGVAVGADVMADGLLTGPRSLGAYKKWGGLASWAVAPAEAVIPLPTGLSYDQGATLLGAYETAWHCLVARGRLQAGETLLVHGASGATGLAAVHIAKILGATVIATGRSPDKLAIVKEQGADHVIQVEEGQPFRDAVRALTAGKGADVVFDGVGGPISVESLHAVRFGGRFLVVGWAATPFVAQGRGGRGAPNVNVLPTNLILMKGLDVLGAPTAISTHKDPSIRAERLAAVLRWVAEGRIVPRIGGTWPLSEVREAMRAKWESRFVGGFVVHP